MTLGCFNVVRQWQRKWLFFLHKNSHALFHTPSKYQRVNECVWSQFFVRWRQILPFWIVVRIVSHTALFWNVYVCVHVHWPVNWDMAEIRSWICRVCLFLAVRAGMRFCMRLLCRRTPETSEPFTHWATKQSESWGFPWIVSIYSVTISPGYILGTISLFKDFKSAHWLSDAGSPKAGSAAWWHFKSIKTFRTAKKTTVSLVQVKEMENEFHQLWHYPSASFVVVMPTQIPVVCRLFSTSLIRPLPQDSKAHHTTVLWCEESGVMDHHVWCSSLCSCSFWRISCFPLPENESHGGSEISSSV